MFEIDLDLIFKFGAGVVASIVIYLMLKHGLLGVDGIWVSKAEPKPSRAQLLEFARWVEGRQCAALDKIQSNGFVFDDLDDRWQKLAFTLYTSLCETSNRSRELLEPDMEVKP